MINIPKVIDLVVENDLCIGCGLCTYKCPNNAIKMDWNDYGFRVPELVGECGSDGLCISVCPFNPFPKKEVETENEIANIFLQEASKFHEKIGKYLGIYVGYSDKYRMTSSSGGMATFVLNELLDKKIVKNIFTVRESEKNFYEYSIISSKEEVLKSSKTRYFPVTLASVFEEIDKLEGKVAVVGIGCFIKAIRLAQYEDTRLKEKIPFLVGIICGGLKSNFFTEYLAGKVGVKKNQIVKPEYRIKNIDSKASDYSFGCNSSYDDDLKTIRMKSVGDMWGTGMFKSNACDFCEDVTTELADISLGDAWLKPYVNEGKGTSVVVTRSPLADKIVRDNISSDKLKMKEFSLDNFLASQKGSFNHRHTGIAYRAKRALKKGKGVPPKRYTKSNELSWHATLVQYFRIYVRKSSLEVWKNENFSRYDDIMKRKLYLLKFFTSLNHKLRSRRSK